MNCEGGGKKLRKGGEIFRMGNKERGISHIFILSYQILFLILQRIIRIVKKFVVLILSVFCSVCPFAQSDSILTAIQNDDSRQKIGLVLSGGGAKGLAHIGVLKALEENNIPVDYIAGTSMGAIIGGLYAAGYSPYEIEQIFYSAEFDDWMARKIDGKYRYYYLSDNDDATMANVGFDLNRKMHAEVPMSLINPIQLDFAFMQFFASANEVCGGDYDKLMMPFFCIASDIGSKSQSIQRSGNLSRSIRASMTFPFFFSPINIDGSLMCDGGMYNNFPAQELNEFYSPDIIIGVKVADNFDLPNEDDLVLYIENMVTVDSKYEIPNSNSVLIEPDMKFISIMDFSNKGECINAGYRYALENIDKIKHFAKDSISLEERNKKREEFNSKKKPPVIGNIIVHGVSPKVKGHIEKLMLMNLLSDSIKLDDLKFNYLNLASMPNIKSIEPKVYYDNFLRTYTFDMNVKTKSILNTKVGGMISTDPISNMFLGLEYNFFHRFSYKIRTNNYFGRYYSSSNLYYRMDFPNQVQPFYADAEINFNRWNFFRNRSGLFEYSANNYIVQREMNAQVRIGTPVSKKSKLQVKLGIGETHDEYFNNSYILSTDTNDVTKFRNFVLGTKFELNSLDDNFFATQGHFIKFNIQYISGTEKFEPGNTYTNHNTIHTEGNLFERKHSWLQVELQTRFYHNVSKHYSFGFITKTYYSFQELFTTQKASLLSAGYFAPTLETFTRFYPEYRTNQFYSGGTEQIYKIGQSFLGTASLRLGLYAFLPVREILSNDDKQPYYSELLLRVYKVGALSLVVSTPLGNLSLALSYTERATSGYNPWNISLSFGKIIFNNKNIER